MRRVTILLAAGLIMLAAATMPTFQADAQQAVVTDDNLDQSLASAKTPTDHEAIASYYDKEAADNENKAKIHHGQHHLYENFHLKTATDMGPHCDALAKGYQHNAAQDKALAAGHRKMAKEVGTAQ